jgi:1-deoxy-D-xylulose-5-phosphate reductoisomerase
MRKIAILGSTGSIGQNALRVIAQYQDRFEVVALAAGRNVGLLAEQIGRFRPRMVGVADEEARRELEGRLDSRSRPAVFHGPSGMEHVAACRDADTVVSAIVGSAGLLPTLAAVRAGKTVALANKETLVMAGALISSEVRRHGATLLPVDSEHSAIYQCLRGHSKTSVRRIILTASGGPFWGRSLEELVHVSPAQALRHPNWLMGEKVTIDSSTLMNKGLEVIEAHFLFDLPVATIDVLIHPQSIVHSIVEFLDGSYLAQLSRPDMRAPIAFALAYPERLIDIIEPIDWEGLSGLIFRKPDTRTFPCLSLAYAALERGGTLPAVLNAANEIAVRAFLDGHIGFTSVPAIIGRVMDAHPVRPADDLEAILEADRWAREKSLEEIRTR